MLDDAPNHAYSASDHASRPIAVTVDNLSKTYPVPFLRLKQFLRRKFKPPVEALRNISFNIREGEIFGLIGPNGAGKTTLTKIIATLIQPTSGLVSVKGHDTVSDDERVRLNVGLAGAEERSFYWRLTSEQNLLFFARLYGLSGAQAKRRIKELFELFEFNELERRRFAELSTGNKQRLSVARAMLAEPPVLLLDEPTRSLDPIAAARMRATISSLAHNPDKRVTIFLTSHNLAEVEELCDRVAIIGKGEIRAVDSPATLRALHTQAEKVSVEFTSLAAENAEHALRQAFSERFFTLERKSGGSQWLLNFSREVGDETLDSVLRVLQQSGATIQSVETERPSLLDVLESYEKEAVRDADGRLLQSERK
jgi:ABC-2 type transport system ATP-binding protein